MQLSIRRMLWSFVAALGVLITLGVALTTMVLERQKREDFILLQVSQPLIEAVGSMDEKMNAVLAASRAFSMTGETQFLQQYDDSVREFETSAARAYGLTRDARSQQLVVDYRRHFSEIRKLTDYQISLVREGKGGNATEAMVEAARIHRLAPDFARMIVDEQRRTIADETAYINSLSQWLVLAMIIGAVIILAGASMLTFRVESSLSESMRRSTRRTEAIVSGMSDGVMLMDSDGKVLFINPAGEEILGTNRIAVPPEEHAREYGLHDVRGARLAPGATPSARALSTGRVVKDVTLRVIRDDRDVIVSSSAVPLHEEGQISFVVVTFRDITDRILLEEQLQVQADTSQTLADAGAYFTSNIDPAWVVQAIAERVANVLGDWAAVVLRSGSSELRVGAIHHRDPELLGSAWSYIYRQPLVSGEGIIGAVVATGSPTLISNPRVRAPQEGDAPGNDLASLLVLPLRSSREMIGALVIGAQLPERAMTDEKMPLAEMLAERASLAIDNANLYTEQVEARRKLEDLSRLKDEFLSIASHELRTPVTSIKGYTQLAKTLIKEDDLQTAEEYLGIALDQIDRMSRLILELLDVSRIETGRLEIRREPIRWSDFVRRIVERHDTMVGDRSIHLATTHSDRIVVGDQDRLEQVLGNLIENAVKYSPDGADVLVSIEERPEQVVTSVADGGIGIPADELPHVFERFHRGRQVSSTNYGGLGLGLYIARQIIERHGGTISVESRHGEGTTFRFTLPTQAPATET